MDAQWLKDAVGDALTLAMADMAKNQPQDPVEFLGKHLIHYVENKEREQAEADIVVKAKEVGKARMEQEARDRASEEKEQEIEHHGKQLIEQALESIRQECQVEYSELKHGDESTIGVADDLGSLVKEKIDGAINFIKESTLANNVYIGKKNADGTVTFIASSDPAILEKSLADEQDDDGVSKVLPFKVFEKPEPVEEEEQEPTEEGEEGSSNQEKEVEEPLPQFIHVTNVLKDDRVPFFGRVPTLGAFLAVNVTIQEAIHPEAIPEDGGLIVEEEPQPSAEEEESGEASESIEETKSSEEEPAAQEQTEELPPKPKRWRANLLESNLVICLDTIGSIGFTNGFTENEIEFVRKLSQNLGKALSETSMQRYQAEMQLRELLDELNRQNKPIFDLEKSEAEEEATAKREEFDKQFEVPEPTEGEEPAEGEEASASPQMSPEETAFKHAQIYLEVIKSKVACASWWKTSLKSQMKICIQPTEDVLKAWNLFLRIFNIVDSERSLEGLKEVDILKLFTKVDSFDAAEVGSEACASLSRESAESFLEELEGLGISEDSPSWVQALDYVSKGALLAVKASAAFKDYLAELEAQRLAAEAEAAAAAAAAEAEGDAEETTEDE